MKFTLQNLGASVGGIVSLALNLSASHRGSVSNTTYVVFIVIMCLGFPFALALPSPERVQRHDGRRVVIKKSPSLAHEFKVLRALLQTKAVLAAMPTMMYAQWFVSYQWQFNYAYFTVRTRALNSMMFYLCGFLISLAMGWFLDWPRFDRRARARLGFWIMFVFVGASWIIGMVVQMKYLKEEPLLDWSEPGFGLGFFVFLLWGMSDPM